MSINSPKLLVKPDRGTARRHFMEDLVSSTHRCRVYSEGGGRAGAEDGICKTMYITLGVNAAEQVLFLNMIVAFNTSAEYTVFQKR